VGAWVRGCVWVCRCVGAWACGCVGAWALIIINDGKSASTQPSHRQPYAKWNSQRAKHDRQDVLSRTGQ